MTTVLTCDYVQNEHLLIVFLLDVTIVRRVNCFGIDSYVALILGCANI